MVQAATKKIGRKKKKAKYDTWSQPRIMTPPDAETSAISTKDDFESQLYLGEVFVFYVLKLTLAEWKPADNEYQQHKKRSAILLRKKGKLPQTLESF